MLERRLPRILGCLASITVSLNVGAHADLPTDPAVADARSLPLVQTALPPVKTDTLSNGNKLFDFGRDAFGGLRLRLHSDTDQQKCTVFLGESRIPNGGVNPHPPGSVRYLRREIMVDAGTRDYDVPLTANDARRMPAKIGPAMPFRYVEFEGTSVSLVGQPVQLAVNYPFNDNAARFTSSDPRLNAIWDLCKYTMKSTSFCGIFVDGDRERLPYEADAYINQLGWYNCSGDFTLPRYTSEYLLTHATWPTEWIFHSIFIAWTDYLYTGDRDSLERIYVALKAKTLDPLADTDGLIRTTDPAVPKDVLAVVHAPRLQDIVDWPAAERDGYIMKPVNTVVNAFRCQALRDMAKIARATNHMDDAAKYDSDATRVAAAINRRLFDMQTGLYVDGEGTSHSSLHANMFALAFGIVPPDRSGNVVAFVNGRGMACSVYGAQYLMEALYATGQGALAQDLMLAPGDRSWAHMADCEATMTMEAWDQKFKPNQDWTHAWGAAPANVIPRLLMGITPSEPGFRKILFYPQPGHLTSASIDLPTIHGSVHEDFHVDNTGFTLHIGVPAGTTADVLLPRHDDSKLVLTVDGVRRPVTKTGDFQVIKDIAPGDHTIVTD